jgi:general secretion pathway protein D
VGSTSQRGGIDLDVLFATSVACRAAFSIEPGLETFRPQRAAARATCPRLLPPLNAIMAVWMLPFSKSKMPQPYFGMIGTHALHVLFLQRRRVSGFAVAIASGSPSPTGWIARLWCIALFCVAGWISPSQNVVWAQDLPLVRRDVAVKASQMQPTQAYLQQLFQGRVYSHPAKAGGILVQVGQESASIEFLSSKEIVRIEGPASLADDIGRISSAIAQSATGVAVRIVPLNDNGQASLRQFQTAPVATSPFTSPGGVSRLPSFLKQRGSQGAGRPATTRIQLASALRAQDPPSGTTAGGSDGNRLTPTVGNAAQPPQDDQEGKPQNTLPLPQFEGVQIEMLPELDAVILRGRDQQLTDLSEIIKRLDEASRLTRPEIEVVPVRHVNSDALAQLIDSIQEKLVGTRQGRVTVTALGSPNALLLIGWGESMTSMKELIQKLDQPSQIEGEYAVIPLQHASATEVQTQLQGFFKTREGLGPVINSIADSRSNAIVVQASPRDLLEIKKILDQIDVPRGGLLQSARVFQLNHSLAADIAEALQDALNTTATERNKSLQLVDENGMPIATSGILGSTRITVNDRNNTIVVSCSPETMPLIEQFIEQLDTPGAVAKIKIFPVRNGDAASLVETLRSLIPSSSPTTGTNPSTQLSSSPDEMSLLPLRFTVDTRGNSIIAIGSDGDLRIVEALILRLDEGDGTQRKSTVYQLKNSPAVDVALSINEFLRSKRQVEIAAPGTNNPFEQLEREVVVVPEPVQNKLILSATPRYYDEISRLIEELDEQPPQVMIQVLIAEIELGNTDEFGVETGLQDSVLFDRSLLGDLVTRTVTTTTSTPAGVVTATAQEIVAASNNPGFNFNNIDPLGNSGSERALATSNRVGGQGISNFGVGRGNQELGFGGLVLSASSENVTFLLRALQDTRRLEILSRPQVLTLDNQQAFIQVGQRIPRIVNSIINQNGTQNVVALENVGLIIGVTPRISPEGNVVMEIDAEKSKLGPEDEGIPISIAEDGTVIRSPRVDTITAQATVSAADGETIILGGLISRSIRTQHRQVPFLGDIPIIKYLFSYDYSDTSRTELLIILTPHVVRTPGDMERLKQAEFARISWCEADVFELHGDVFPQTGMMSQLLDQGDCQVVYPDIDPRGELRDLSPSPAAEAAIPLLGPPTSLEEEVRRLPQPESLPSPVENPASRIPNAPAGITPPRPLRPTSTQPSLIQSSSNQSLSISSSPFPNSVQANAAPASPVLSPIAPLTPSPTAPPNSNTTENR